VHSLFHLSKTRVMARTTLLDQVPALRIISEPNMATGRRLNKQAVIAYIASHRAVMARNTLLHRVPHERVIERGL